MLAVVARHFSVSLKPHAVFLGPLVHAKQTHVVAVLQSEVLFRFVIADTVSSAHRFSTPLAQTADPRPNGN